MQPNQTASTKTYQIPQELINSILAECGLESLAGDAEVEPLDDNVSER